ncbi:recombinase family protein [Paenibacillus endoradicis]|uniref:recombinase family protein n=1 Tax=Paenibacillus endoradicis TaxID=2972487 RepID=UPI002159B2FA|nr:recombinase family protein [Paenibacillus endoradicis]MCR8655840.1 recombinase family protein [Paenibacillus endoradicis]MCR8658166.1 recombinase family protein [Paenibacillus endoradicis]
MKSMLNKSEIKGKIGAFYGRVSTNAQDLNMQQESCQFFIQKYECSINHRYTEELSATRNPLEKRKELMKLIADAEEGLFDFVVIYNHDRLARNPIEHLKIRRIFNEIGIPVYASSTESNYSYKDILSNALRDNYSKVEADNIRVRMKDSILTRVHQGKWTGGKLPYGVEYVNPLQELNIDSKKKLRFVKDKILVVQKIYELYISGFGFKAIANYANEHRLDTGFLWSKERVKFIVTNPIYAGYLSIYKRKAKSTNSTNDKNSWEIHKMEELEPIIDKHLWEQCFELYRSRKEKEVSNPRYLTTPYLLKDIIHCKNCRRKLLTKDQRSKGYGEKIYYCSGN